MMWTTNVGMRRHFTRRLDEFANHCNLNGGTSLRFYWINAHVTTWYSRRAGEPCSLQLNKVKRTTCAWTLPDVRCFHIMCEVSLQSHTWNGCYTLVHSVWVLHEFDSRQSRFALEQIQMFDTACRGSLNEVEHFPPPIMSLVFTP